MITLGESGDIVIKYNVDGTYKATSGNQAITGKWSFRNNETQFVDESQTGQQGLSDIVELSPTVFRAKDVETHVEAIFVSLSPNLAAPKQISPSDGATFNVFPRTTTLQWSAVTGASGYRLQVDCYSCCEGYKWCTDVGGESSIEQVKDTSYTFEWVGAQKGRWRVWAIDETGEGPKTGWWVFDHKQ